MHRHRQPRQPKKTGGFSWGRSVRDGSVTYRLFRRDQRGVLHAFTCTWSGNELSSKSIRKIIAEEIHRARHALRDQVDVVDLALMGVTQ